MTIHKAAQQLEILRDTRADFAVRSNPNVLPLWRDDVAACDVAAEILAALDGEIIETVEDAVSMIRNYPIVIKKCRALRDHFERGEKPVWLHGVLSCPKCHRRVGRTHQYCWWCGQRLGK